MNLQDLGLGDVYTKLNSLYAQIREMDGTVLEPKVLSPEEQEKLAKLRNEFENEKDRVHSAVRERLEKLAQEVWNGGQTLPSRVIFLSERYNTGLVHRLARLIILDKNKRMVETLDTCGALPIVPSYGFGLGNAMRYDVLSIHLPNSGMLDPESQYSSSMTVCLVEVPLGKPTKEELQYLKTTLLQNSRPFFERLSLEEIFETFGKDTFLPRGTIRYIHGSEYISGDSLLTSSLTMDLKLAVMPSGKWAMIAYLSRIYKNNRLRSWYKYSGTVESMEGLTFTPNPDKYTYTFSPGITYGLDPTDLAWLKDRFKITNKPPIMGE